MKWVIEYCHLSYLQWRIHALLVTNHWGTVSTQMSAGRLNRVASARSIWGVLGGGGLTGVFQVMHSGESCNDR